MSSIPNIPIWEQFFDTWRELPELWKVKSDIYKNRNKKKIASEKLLEVYKQIEPNANIDSLKKRLTNIRTCYRRELKKVQEGEKSWSGAEYEYVPNLWYFTALQFLHDQEIQVAGTSAADLKEIESEEHELIVSNSMRSYFCEDDDFGEMGGERELWTQRLEESAEPIQPPSLSQKRKRTGQRDMLMIERNNILKDAVERMNNDKDDATVFANSWAVSYRKLSPTQRLFAKKAIDDVLILGQLGLLTLSTVDTSSHSNSSSRSSAPQTPFPAPSPPQPSPHNST